MSAKRQRVLEGGGLVVQFLWHVDRFAHRFWLAESDRAGGSPLASIEGTPADAWPPSPALQSLDTEGAAGQRQVALLVGMAGKCHWSASVELDPAAGCIRFDVACRVSAGEGGMLGSRYVVARSRPVVDSRQTIVPTAGDNPMHGLCIRVDGDDEDARLCAADDETLAIQPCVPPPGASSRTIRWRYTVARVAL